MSFLALRIPFTFRERQIPIIVWTPGIFLIVSITAGLLMWYNTNFDTNTETLYLAVIIAPVLLLICAAVGTGEYLNKRRVYTILDSNLFNELKQQGFAEEFDESDPEKLYVGLIRHEPEGSVRVHYDTAKRAKGFLSFADIVVRNYFEAQFQPGSNDKALSLYAERYSDMEMDIHEPWGMGWKCFVSTSETLSHHLNYHPWLSAKRINWQIDWGRKLHASHGFAALDLSTREKQEYTEA